MRISGIPKKAEEKQIKIHFSKPQNGGGFIKKIYYPLFNNDAVIMYQDPEGIRKRLSGRDLAANPVSCIDLAVICSGR